MKKWLIAILILIVLMIAIIAGYFIKIKFDERNEITVEYKLYSCMVQCPIVPYGNTSYLTLDQNCSKDCFDNLIEVPNFRPISGKYMPKQFRDCAIIFAEASQTDRNNSFVVLKDCWINALPEVKKDYPYVSD